MWRTGLVSAQAGASTPCHATGETPDGGIGQAIFYRDGHHDCTELFYRQKICSFRHPPKKATGRKILVFPMFSRMRLASHASVDDQQTEIYP